MSSYPVSKVERTVAVAVAVTTVAVAMAAVATAAVAVMTAAVATATVATAAMVMTTAITSPNMEILKQYRLVWAEPKTITSSNILYL